MTNLVHPGIFFDYGGLFSTSEEWIHPDRTERTHEIIYVTEGQVYMNDDGSEICLEKGQLLLLEANKRHFGYKKSSRVSFYWLHFHTDIPDFDIGNRFLARFDNAYLFKELLHYAFLSSDAREMVSSILVRILTEIKYLGSSNCAGKDKTAAEIYEWLRVNAKAGLTAKKTAKHFGFSPDHVSRLLKKHYGAGTKAITERLVLAKAKEMLNTTGKYVKEIAYELGFTDDKAFIGFFKYHEGVYPSAFRSRFYMIHMNNR